MSIRGEERESMSKQMTKGKSGEFTGDQLTCVVQEGVYIWKSGRVRVGGSVFKNRCDPGSFTFDVTVTQETFDELDNKGKGGVEFNLDYDDSNGKVKSFAGKVPLAAAAVAAIDAPPPSAPISVASATGGSPSSPPSQ